MTVTHDNDTAPTEASEPDAPPAGRRRWPRRVAMVTATVAVFALVGWLGLRWITPHPYSGTVMQAPTPAPSMEGLYFTDGTPVDASAYDGDLLLVFFGYTGCPDVCPTTLSQVAAAKRMIGGDADRVNVMMVSVDPERDSLTDIDDYVKAFDPSFRGATGDMEAIERVAAQYGVFFARGEDIGAAGGGYTVDHTASLMGIDRDGHLRIVWPASIEAERLAADLDELL